MNMRRKMYRNHRDRVELCERKDLNQERAELRRPMRQHDPSQTATDLKPVLLTEDDKYIHRNS
jgi:hypothetical protein